MWNVFLPKGHQLEDFDGNMKQVQPRENLLTILQCDLTELKQINTIGADKTNPQTARQLSVGNGGILAERIEKNLKQLAASGFQGMEENGLEQELEQQKVIITENRVEMPLFNQGDIQIQQNGNVRVGGGFQGQQNGDSANIGGQFQGQDRVDWGFGNNAKIVNRNKFNADKVTKQIAQVESQVRLNDNISIANDFAKEDGKKVAAQTASEGTVTNFSQIGKLAEGKQGARSAGEAGSAEHGPNWTR